MSGSMQETQLHLNELLEVKGAPNPPLTQFANAIRIAFASFFADTMMCDKDCPSDFVKKFQQILEDCQHKLEEQSSLDDRADEVTNVLNRIGVYQTLVHRFSVDGFAAMAHSLANSYEKLRN